ncbi:protein translocase subunit SecF [Desulfohalobium retbaense]|uniref:Protein-export membrane protein SecF n=1 Tax=Desulfohalobium retbaense (strain ATCC 49708 / DSM 5692 / JCM 16813 / HR100) TaxID=485915 RepID=C8X141_DESRD|nr:protein translocase subunit SecF [Desulfohalobium retbaense]ACV68138.1 protein-export membrane protein SecF [Desulfohalobium retbaense DSM 5692]
MGLQLIKPGTAVNFIGRRKIALVVSALVLLLGLGSLLLKGGPKYGIDFAGGITVQTQFAADVSLKDIKAALATAELPSLNVQKFGTEGGNEYLFRVAAVDISSSEVRQAVQEALSAEMDTGFEIRRLEMVGPKVGADLRAKALEALFYAILIISIYISGRFEHRWLASALMAGGLAGGLYVLQIAGFPLSALVVAALVIAVGMCWYLKLNFALGAVIALIHDVLVTVGVFSLLNKEFDLSIVAALLTIIGYSLNDTIIVFDRIRENLRGKAAKHRSLKETINISINQTLSRTILTSGTTLLVVISLFLFGGGVIHNFAFALLVGVIVGTYSSIFVASPLLLGFQIDPPEEKDAVQEQTV